MPITDYKIVGGYYTAGHTPLIDAAVNAEVANGWVPFASPQLLSSGFVYQALVKGAGSCSEYVAVTGYTDNRTPKMMPKVGWIPVGSPVALASNYFLQAYMQGVPYGEPLVIYAADIADATPFGISVITGDSININDVDGISVFGMEVLTQDGIYSTDILDSTVFGRSVITGTGIAISNVTGLSVMGAALVTGSSISTSYLSPSTAFGRSLLNLADAAALRALIPVSNLVYRASFTTTGADIFQNISSANTAQTITFNAEAIANAAIGTLVQASGVFTTAAAFTGVLGFSAQMRRAGNLLSVATWLVQVETSPDGVTWTPVSGSARRESLPALSGEQVHVVDLAVAISLAAGDRLRFRQAADNVSAAVGLAANQAGIGGTTSAGFIFSLYTAR